MINDLPITNPTDEIRMRELIGFAAEHFVNFVVPLNNPTNRGGHSDPFVGYEFAEQLLSLYSQHGS
jgi:hypothetical protein